MPLFSGISAKLFNHTNSTPTAKPADSAKRLLNHKNMPGIPSLDSKTIDDFSKQYHVQKYDEHHHLQGVSCDSDKPDSELLASDTELSPDIRPTRQWCIASSSYVTIPKSQWHVDMADIEGLMQQVSVIKFTDENDQKILGIRCKKIQPGSLLDSLGLQNGDAVVGVNGGTIKSVDEVRGFLRKIITANSVEMSVERSGKSHMIICDIM